MEKKDILILKEGFKNFLEDAGYSEQTIRTYGEVWFKKFPHILFNSADNDEAQEIIDKFVQKKKHNNTVSRAFLKLYLEFTGLSKKFNIPKAKPITRQFRFKDTLSLKEIEILGKAMFNAGYDKWLAFRLIYEGGLRRSELASVKYNRFDWDTWFNNPERDVVLKVIGKGNKERFVTISANTIKKHFSHLQAKHGLSELELLKVMQNAKNQDQKVCKFGEEWFYKHLTKTSKKVLNKNVNPHLIRHSKATHLLDAGAEIKDIQNYLGHSSLSTTELYLHRDKKKSIQNIMALN